MSIPEEAERRYTNIFSTLNQRWSDTHVFRRLAELGAPLAKSRLVAENNLLAQRIAHDAEYDELFIDKAKAVEFFGGTERLAMLLTQRELTSFQRAVDAASLIFVHSALDAAVSDLCRVCALIAPTDWEPFLSNQKIPLSQAKSSSFVDLLQSKLKDHLQVLEREALLVRVERLFALCKPPAGFSPKRDYSYDRSRLQNLDDLRHRIVHGDTAAVALGDVPASLQFLFDSGLYLFVLVNQRYGVKVNPLYMLKAQPATGS
jgi:hypothetical protein